VTAPPLEPPLLVAPSLEPPLLLEALLLAGLPLSLGIKGRLPLFVLVEADGIVLELTLLFEPGATCDGIVFEVNGDDIGGGGIVFKEDGVGGSGILFEVDGGMLLD
ncbi:hypothetical protein Tco_0042150, partial [Tanacetum coccineum]